MPIRSHKTPAGVTSKQPVQAGLRRTSRKGVKKFKNSLADESTSASDSQDGNEGGEGEEEASEEDAENGDTDEPEEFAPSRSIKRKPGHRTGLSNDFSKAGISMVPKKRSMSDSSEATIPPRPHKHNKTGDDESDINSLSGDEGYDEVANISDSEVDYSAIEQAETELVIEAEEDRWRRGDDFPQVGIEDSAFEEAYARTLPHGSGNYYELNDGTVSAPAEETPTRRVRFAGIDTDSSSGSASSSDVENAFPDLLAQPIHYSRQDFEFPEEDDDGSSESFWDMDPNNPFAEEDRKLAELGFYDEPEESSSGYETDSDDGTTTEEEPEPLHSVSLPKKMLELRSNSPLPAGQRPRRLGMPRTRTVTPSTKGKGPVLGTWIADPSKPIAIINKDGGLKYYHVPHKTFGAMSTQVSSAESSPQRSFVPLARPATADGVVSAGNILGSDASCLTALQGSDLLSSDAFLPMELEDAALYEEFEDDEDDISDTLNINDLIDFGESSSDEEKPCEESPSTPKYTTPKLPKITPKQSADRPSSHNLLEHLDRSGSRISAFRRNQTRTAHFGRWPVSGLLAIKGGRHNMANNPISPLRKRKVNHGMSHASSPLNGVNTKQRYVGTIGGTRNRKNTF